MESDLKKNIENTASAVRTARNKQKKLAETVATKVKEINEHKRAIELAEAEIEQAHNDRLVADVEFGDAKRRYEFYMGELVNHPHGF